MITDVLFEARSEIERYLIEQPDVYKDVMPDINRLLKEMNKVIKKLNPKVIVKDNVMKW